MGSQHARQDSGSDGHRAVTGYALRRQVESGMKWGHSAHLQRPRQSHAISMMGLTLQMNPNNAISFYRLCGMRVAFRHLLGPHRLSLEEVQAWPHNGSYYPLGLQVTGPGSQRQYRSVLRVAGQPQTSGPGKPSAATTNVTVTPSIPVWSPPCQSDGERGG